MCASLISVVNCEAVSYTIQILSFGFCPIAFLAVNFANRNRLAMRKNLILLCVQRFEQTPRATAAVTVWRREKTRWVRCTARRTQACEQTLTAFGLAEKRRAERAIVNLSWYFVFDNVTN